MTKEEFLEELSEVKEESGKILGIFVLDLSMQKMHLYFYDFDSISSLKEKVDQKYSENLVKEDNQIIDVIYSQKEDLEDYYNTLVQSIL